MSKYTDEMVQRMVAEYDEKRNSGELNRDIMQYLVDLLFMEYEVEVNAASVRAKLMGPDGNYVKDTDAEKEILQARDGKVKKAKRETKAAKATNIADLLGLDVGDDLKVLKADTLDAVRTAVLSILSNLEDAVKE